MPPSVVLRYPRRSLFKGHLVIHSGGAASGFKNSTETDSYDTDGVCLFHVKGTQPDNTYGVQVSGMYEPRTPLWCGGVEVYGRTLGVFHGRLEHGLSISSHVLLGPSRLLAVRVKL